MNQPYIRDICDYIATIESNLTPVSSQVFLDLLYQILRALGRHTEEGTDFLSLAPEFRNLIHTLDTTDLYSYRPTSPIEKMYRSGDPHAGLGYSPTRVRDDLPDLEP